MARRTPRSRSLAVQAAELAVAAPQVVAHRVGRMMLAGPSPSAKDRREFSRMGAEKAEAFAESWLAMSATAWRLQLEWWQGLVRAGLTPWPWGAPWGRVGAGQGGRDAARVLASGLGPVHRRAVANARRLARTRA